MKIKLLDSLLTAQIAAGEVIERPASVVKELLENSLDAKASRLEIEITKAGSEVIRVCDDGEGIAREDLPLTIMRYATSKINSLQDLERIGTLGFRGEALASISSVSRFTLASRIQGEKAGWQVSVAGQNSSVEISPLAHPVGTSVEVRDLFFNTPARRKFLRSENTEFRQLAEIVCRLALSRFDIGFVLKHNGRLVQQLEAAGSQQEKESRVAALCGSDFIDRSYALKEERSGLKLTGWVSKPTFSRSQADTQYFYINGRMVRDKLIAHAIRQAYQDVLTHGRQPAYVLYLELDAQLIDVNVHPTKMEVRFRDSRNIHNFLLFSIKQVLKETFAAPERLAAVDADAAVDLYLQEQHKKQPFSEEEILPVSQKAQQVEGENVKIKPKANLQLPEQIELPFAHVARLAACAKSANFLASDMSESEEDALDACGFKVTKDLGHALAQLDGTYVLAQNSSGLVIIDIHAAHERITYERLKRAYTACNMPAQTLLLPLTLTVQRKEAAVAEEYRDELKKCGLKIECLGAETLIVRQMPALINPRDSKQFIYDLLADLGEYETCASAQNYSDKILASFACHHSLRAKHELSTEEMNALLRQLEQTQRGDQCSHGRPTWIEIPFAKIAKMFLRS